MKILIVEDDKILARTIEQCLSNKYDIDKAYDGEEGVMYAKQGIYDAIVLDLMMPIMNGFDVLRELRKSKIYTPVLVLTAKGNVTDKVGALNIGADDYLVKPFNREELIARIDAIIRRTTGNYTENILQYKDMIIDLSSRTIKIKDEEVFLQGKQFDMLTYLVTSKNTIITKDQIFDKIWGLDSETTTNVIEVYASGIRKELKKSGYDKYLKTIRGVGYIWSE